MSYNSRLPLSQTREFDNVVDDDDNVDNDDVKLRDTNNTFGGNGVGENQIVAKKVASFQRNGEFFLPQEDFVVR